MRQVFTIGLIFLCATTALAELPDLPGMPRKAFALHEDFEQSDPVRLWEATGKFKVMFKGLTDEAAQDGARSFKLDIVFEEDGQCIWRIPLAVPLEERMVQVVHWRAGAHSDADEVGLGYAVMLTPTDRNYRRAGAYIRGRVSAEKASEWRVYRENFMVPGWPKDLITSETRGGPMSTNLVGVGKYDVGAEMDPLIWIKGRAGQRAVIYIDNLRLEGKAPDFEAYRKAAPVRYNAAAAPFHAQLRSWSSRYDQAVARLSEIGQLPEPIEACRTSLVQAATHQRARLLAMIDDGYAGWKELDPIMDTLWAAEHSEEGLRALGQLEATPSLVHYGLRAIANTPVLNGEIPKVGAVGADIEVAACRGEIEPASFAVYALDDLENVTLDISDLKGPAVIPAKAIDPFVVKVWYRAGFYSGDPHGRFLVPNLLLKDDDLVRVDTDQQHNYVRSTAEDGTEEYLLCSGPTSDHLENMTPRQAKTLQPVTIPAGTTKAFWLTIYVPEDSAPGDYRGTVTLRYESGKPHRIPLHLKVHAFDLPPSPLTYSVFNRGRLTDAEETPAINSEYLHVDRYEREIRNQVLHGVLHPNSYDGFRMLRPALEARRRAGVATDRFFCVDLSYRVREASAGKEGFLEDLPNRIAQWKELLSEYGYDELWVMGVDEARGHKVLAERPVIEVIHKAGAKVWAAATHETTFDNIGDLLDLGIMAGYPKPEEVKRWHGVGHQVFGYGGPMTEWDHPETFRRNQGLWLWKVGYDGFMHYAYRHGMGHVWNDFDHERRDHTFVLPIVDGLIDTIAWEGVREGIDDTRYATALVQAIKDAKDRKLAAEAQKFIDEMNTDTIMDELRAEIVDWIVRLQ